MSKVLINKFYSDIERAMQFGKSWNETAIRNHTWNLLKRVWSARVGDKVILGKMESEKNDQNH